jgi:hypothetical protein
MKIVVAKETKARFSPMKRTANQKKKCIFAIRMD